MDKTKFCKDYEYVATIDWDIQDKAYIIEFPDIDGAFTYAEKDEDITYMAGEVLSLFIYDFIVENKTIPKPTKLKDIKLAKNQFTTFIKVSYKDFKKIRTINQEHWL